MALQDILLRSESHLPLSTKGSELTFGELDGNFIELYDYLSGMNSASGIAPYDNLVTYTGTEYVSFDGNIYVHISATSTTGVFPNTDATKWQLTSIGAIAHQKDKDSFLAFGSASQVSATDLSDIINNQIINITYANFIIAKNGAQLKVNRLYCITNAVNYIDTGVYANSQIKLYIRTTSTTEYSRKGFISFVAPNYDSFIVYDYTNPYVVGDIVGYGLFVYECINNTINGDIPEIDTTNWTIKSYISFPNYYEIKFYDVDFSIENSAINIWKVLDTWGNTFGVNDFLNSNIATFQQISSNNIDISSVFRSYGFVGGVYTNTLINSSQIFAKGGVLSFSMSGNYLNRGGIYCDEFINGIIIDNNLTNAQLNLINGNFSGTLQNVKIEFANSYSLDVNNDTIVQGGYMNELGSNITAQVNIIGTGGIVNLDTLLTYADIYGVFEMECGGDLIDYLLKTNYFCPIVIKPITPHSYLTIKIYNLVSANTNNLVSSIYSSNIDLYTDNGDYAVLERVFVNGYTLWNVTYINQIQ